MYIIIAGCGRIGSNLAKDLLDDGHDLVIVDRDKQRLDLLGTGLNATRILGIEYDLDILREAGIENADVFLALTQNDSINITACQVAKDIFNVNTVVAKVADVSKEHIYKSLNIQYINPIKLGIEALKSRI
ncbi:potassium channel family protein [Romboutsia lituseburensis]|uniref:TrkA-N domain-containing protein n=1 Tax=Romboutsia lituseburensis DSM 797 TaxID=1121325 RepID=A0A1G9PFJ2_9FIRM|nr:TrkA family potassium uptake protein [Romboutsia lituseburensis]CEH33358.1 K+ uptake protein, NAD-binding subunit TrkA2 [Romboutsia lituseburensis]SDL97333.1 TrkA-N domain-containing protein [Romboutsia lituseburensis DSM 797]